jgi:cytochrome c oxidase subunit II
MNDWLRRLLDLPPQASTYASRVDLLHYFVITTTMGGATFVFLLGLYFLIRYRQRVPGETTAHTTTSVLQETFIIASLQVLFLAFWVVGAVLYDHIMTPPAGAMVVYVTAKQWMWKFAYPDGRASLDVLTVPVNRDVELVMTSRDGIHSFYVPAFRMKHDVVPGRYYTAWFQANTPGTYSIECAEYCGVGHSRMLGRVQVLGQADYAKWLADRPSPDEDALAGQTALSGGDLAAVGKEVAARRGCLSCHTIDGQPHIGPSWAGLFGSEVPLAGGRTVRADEEYLTRSMMDPQADIVAGYQPVMPTYRGLLAEPEVGALVEFIRSIRSRPFAPTITLPRVKPLGSAQPQEPRP